MADRFLARTGRRGRGCHHGDGHEGRITLVTDPLSRTVGFGYDANGDLVEVTDVNGGTTLYTYDNHRLTSLQDSNENMAMQQIYDEADRVVEQVDAVGGITCLYYGSGPTYTSTNCPGVTPAPVAGQTIIVDPRDNETLYDFDTSFRTVGITDHLGGITEFAYNAAAQRTCASDLRGNKTRFEYDTAGNVTKIVDAAHTDSSCGDAGVDWSFTYTSLNDVDLITDPLGRQTDFVYNGAGNLTEVISKDSGGSTVARTCYTRDSTGQATEVIVSTTLSDCTGNRTLLEYDTRGNIVEITDPRFASAGTPVTTLAYDLGGRLLSVTNELGHTTEYTYDNKNAVLTVEDNLGNVTEYDYDAKGNMTSITDANLNTTTYIYDDADRLIEVIDALSQSTEYAYDGNDNLTTVENAKENTTTYAYDALNRLVEVSDPLSRATTYSYDAAGNLDTRTDARGLVTDYAYDSLNRLTNIDYSGSTTPDVAFTYDDVSNRLSMADGTGTTSYVHDALNRLTEVTFPGSRTVDYDYDNAGNHSRIEYPGGTRDVDYTYDPAGRMLTVTDWLSNVTEYTYNNAGYLTLTELPNGVTAEYLYDTADRLTSLINEGPGGVLSSFTYTLDDVGNRTQVVTPEGTESYTYDDLYRLTGVTYPDSTSESFSYDAVGNRTATAVLAYTYDDADQMLTAGSTSFDYDSNGNQTERGSGTLSYDHENRLVSGTFGSTSISMAYDGDGLRQSLTEGSQTNDFVWDVAAGLPVILEEDSRTYVYGLGLISSVDGSNAGTYYSYDGLGSVANLSHGNGQPIVSYAYEAFGEIRTETGTAENHWLFTGEQRDAASSLYFLRSRYYDPAIGRFLEEDTFHGRLGEPSSQHTYEYVRNNPATWMDPDGRDPFGVFAPLCPICDRADEGKIAAHEAKQALEEAWGACKEAALNLNAIRAGQCLDLLPVAEVCGVAGKRPRDFCDSVIEPFFGALGWVATEIEIAIECFARGDLREGLLATAVNTFNAINDRPSGSFAKDEARDLALYHLGNEIIATCGGKE